jgi:hypothetical protein
MNARVGMPTNGSGHFSEKRKETARLSFHARNFSVTIPSLKIGGCDHGSSQRTRACNLRGRRVRTLLRGRYSCGGSVRWKRGLDALPEEEMPRDESDQACGRSGNSTSDRGRRGQYPYDARRHRSGPRSGNDPEGLSAALVGSFCGLALRLEKINLRHGVVRPRLDAGKRFNGRAERAVAEARDGGRRLSNVTRERGLFNARCPDPFGQFHAYGLARLNHGRK